MANEGYAFDIFSIKPSRDKIVHEPARALLTRLIYRKFLFSKELFAAQTHYLKNSPNRYFKALFLLIFHMVRSPIALAKSLTLFPKAVCYARLMKERDVAHIHAFWATFPCTIAWIANRLEGIPYSFSAHAHDIYEDDTMLRAKLKHTRLVMTCTDFNQRYLAEMTPQQSEAIQRIYHGKPLSALCENARFNVNGDGAFRILSIGTFYKTKGFDTLIETCALLKEYGVQFECRIVGDGPKRRNIRAQIAKFGLEKHVKLLGYLPQAEIQPLREWAHVFILLARPDLHWGLPNVFIESLAAKLAVIGTPLNAMPELVRHEETGFIVAPNDPQAAAAAIMRMKNEPEKRREMTEKGQECALALFDEKETSKQFISAFENLLSNSHSQNDKSQK